MPIEIRSARIGDLAGFLEIEEAWSTSLHWNKTHFEREIEAEGSYFVAATEEEEVLGFAGLLKVAPEAQVTTISVRPDRARKGLGRKLMEHIVEAAKGWGYKKVTLEVSHANAPAIGLYESLGFVVVGRRAKFYNDGSDGVLMDLNLD